MQCFECKRVLSRFMADDIVEELHSSFLPLCPFVEATVHGNAIKGHALAYRQKLLKRIEEKKNIIPKTPNTAPLLDPAKVCSLQKNPTI